MEYVIRGDTDDGIYKDCLVLVCGTSKDTAENTLKRILTNPNEMDSRLIKGIKNLHISEVSDKDCWWNFSCD